MMLDDKEWACESTLSICMWWVADQVLERNI